jgi:hypothetical protein
VAPSSLIYISHSPSEHTALHIGTQSLQPDRKIAPPFYHPLGLPAHRNVGQHILASPHYYTHPITMSSPKQKKVHYERGTKGSKSSHHHHNSRDSGVGSSSASDRASLGTAPNEYAYNDRQVEDQRYNLRVVQEALDAAYERIRHLEASNSSLNDSLTESNKENRALRKEKSGLIKENDDLLDAIEDLNQRLKRETSPRSASGSGSASTVKPERRPSSRKGPDSPRQHYIDERPLSNHSDRRSSMYDRAPPSAPQPPPNPHPNPFAPRTPSVTYAAVPASVSYSPSAVSYSQTPLYAVTPHGSNRYPKHDDGKYHLQPL